MLSVSSSTGRVPAAHSTTPSAPRRTSAASFAAAAADRAHRPLSLARALWLGGVDGSNAAPHQHQQQQQQQQHQRRPSVTCASWLGGSGGSNTAQQQQTQLSPLPASHDQAIRQAQLAAERALADGLRLLEVEVPPVAITAVAGDGDGQREMNESLRLLRQFLGASTFRDRAPRVRVMFGDPSELQVATRGSTLDPAAGRAQTEPMFPRGGDAASGQPEFAVGYLTRPNALWSLTGVNWDQWSPVVQVKEEDEVVVVSAPTFNAKEELRAARAIWEEKCVVGNGSGSGSRAMIVFNGELEKLREGYYPPMFFRELARINEEWLPKMQTVYSVRNFRGSRPAALVRCYPNAWTLYRRDPYGEALEGEEDDASVAVPVWSGERRPSLKEVALEILPGSDAALREVLGGGGGGGGGRRRR
jgi:hypothetical protein